MEQIEETTNGGKQSKIAGLPTLIPPYALKELSKVMGEGGRKYGKDNWHNIPVNTQQAGDTLDVGELDHALQHYLNFATGEGDPLEELSHFAARAVMALDQYIRDNQ